MIHQYKIDGEFLFIEETIEDITSIDVGCEYDLPGFKTKIIAVRRDKQTIDTSDGRKNLPLKDSGLLGQKCWRCYWLQPLDRSTKKHLVEMVSDKLFLQIEQREKNV